MRADETSMEDAARDGTADTAAGDGRPGIGTLLFGPTGKVMALSFLVLVLLIPTVMVSSLVGERERRATAVAREIGEQWGASQTVTGPLLLVPATVRIGADVEPQRTVSRRTARNDVALEAAEIEPARSEPSADGETRLVRDTVIIRPQMVEARVEADTETRRRSIYEARVYTAEATLTARFAPLAASEIGPDVVALDWSNARLAVGVSDLAAIDDASFTVDGRALPDDELEPGLGLARSADEPGVRTGPLGLSAPRDGAPVPFEATARLVMRGSDRIGIAPAGLDTEARIVADWPHPGFTGARLPREREIGAEGFEALWSISRLSLPHAAAWPANSGGIGALVRDAVEVRLVEPVDHYARVGRAVRHGTLVLIGVFAVAFLIDLFAPGTLSVVQYLMVGAMIVVFYVLLLALSEHVAFAAAYALAAGASGAVLAGFVGSVAGGRRWALIAAAAFAVLYAMLYAVLGLEDFALLAGAIFTFALLTVLMFATRRVDWSGRSLPSRRTT